MLKVIEIALAEVGYHEKESNYDLDSPTGNAGDQNYTKYARDIDQIAGFYNGPKQGFAYCDVFTDWCMIRAYGVQMAKRLLCQPDYSAGAGCPYSCDYYKAAGQFHKTGPKEGDQIFFIVGSIVGHTGLVYAVDGSRVYTVEGNTSDQVAKRSYALNDARIYGYGRPNYALVNEAEEAPKEEVPKEEAPKADDKKEEEERGDVTVLLNTLRRGCKGSQVKTLQVLLINKHYISCGSWGADGDFGSGTESAVLAFQRIKGLEADGIAGHDTWAALLK